jgi:hypothetical protein
MSKRIDPTFAVTVFTLFLLMQILFMQTLFMQTLFMQTSPSLAQAQSQPKHPRSGGAQVNQSWWPFEPVLKGSGNLVASERAVRRFSSIELGVAIQANVVQTHLQTRLQTSLDTSLDTGLQAVEQTSADGEYGVRVICDDNLAEHLKTEVTGDGVLRVFMDAKAYQYDSMSIVIRLPVLTALRLDRGAYACVEAPFRASVLKTSLVGEAAHAEFLGGTVGKHSIVMESAGNIFDGERLRSDESSITMTGLGGVCSVDAAVLDMNTPGWGTSVFYKGSPVIRSQSTGFMRSVIPINTEKEEGEKQPATSQPASRQTPPRTPQQPLKAVPKQAPTQEAIPVQRKD